MTLVSKDKTDTTCGWITSNHSYCELKWFSPLYKKIIFEMNFGEFLMEDSSQWCTFIMDVQTVLFIKEERLWVKKHVPKFSNLLKGTHLLCCSLVADFSLEHQWHLFNRNFLLAWCWLIALVTALLLEQPC